MSMGPSDSERDLERRIRIFLDVVAFPNPDRIGIAVTGGTVLLQGSLATVRERDLSVAFCRRVAGVLRIVDDLTVGTFDAENASLCSLTAGAARAPAAEEALV